MDKQLTLPALSSWDRPREDKIESVNLVLVSRESDVIDLRWQQCVSIIHRHPFVRQAERWWGGGTHGVQAWVRVILHHL